MPPELHLLRPLWLLALIPLGLLLIALWRRRPTDAAWRRVVDAHLLPHLLAGTSGPGRRLPLALLGAGWLAGVLALAGPTWERLPQPVFGSPAKRVILLDLSPSMNAADVAPSRLARARFEVLDLLGAAREGQVALIAFGPEPFIVSPLTGDAQTIAAQVPRLSPDLLPVPGPRRTDRALELAGQLLRQAGADRGEIVLIADAVHDPGGDADAALAAALTAAGALADSGVRVSVLGIGTPQGAPEPGRDGAFARDRNGSVRIARLDRPGLAALAQAGNGIYLEPDPGDRDTRALLARGADGGAGPALAPPGVPGLMADRWQEAGPWLLLGLLPVAALAFRRGWLLPALLLALPLPPGVGWAADPPAAQPGGWPIRWGDLWERPDRQAARTLADGDAQAAAARFRDPGWRAAARYRAGDYQGALADLAELAGPEADYNRGNALARLGRLDESIAAYRRALAQAPDHGDARANLALVERLKAGQGQADGPDPGERGGGGEGGESRDETGDGTGAGAGAGAGDGPGGSPGGDPQAGSQAGRGGAGDGHPPGPQGAGAPRTAPDGTSAPRPSGTGRDGDRGADPGGGGPAGTDPGGPDDPGPTGAGTTAGRSGTGASQTAPGAFRADALEGEPEVALREGDGAGRPADPAASDAAPAGAPDLGPQARERLQSMEAQLRRVPDDPAGLLRQRFLLQHLRREGRLP